MEVFKPRLKVSLPMAGRLELGDLYGLFQPKLFCASIFSGPSVCSLGLIHDEPVQPTPRLLLLSIVFHSAKFKLFV